MSDYFKIKKEYAPLKDSVPKVNKNFVEVVRCKDCKHIKEEHFNILPDGFSCELSGLMVEQEHYCSYGERADK